MKYDVAIVGAGIAGTSCAYFLNQAGLKVLLIDKKDIASGGSGAAGAFISPKIEKHGELNQLSQKAYKFSLNFYKENFPDLITISELTHIIEKKESYLNESGLVNAEQVCEALSGGIDFQVQNVKNLEEIPAKKIILSTGAYEPLLKKPYLKLRAIFGHRIDIKSSTDVAHHYHEEVSISKSVLKNNTYHSSIGATHDVHMKFEDVKTYDVKVGRTMLLEKASKTLSLKDVEIIQDHLGFRSGSNDYMPHLGNFVDEEKTIEKFPQIKHGRYYKDLIYHENIFTFNGLGGYGFVLAPYLAKILSNHITEGKEIPQEFLVERFFRRWVKKR